MKEERTQIILGTRTKQNITKAILENETIQQTLHGIAESQGFDLVEASIFFEGEYKMFVIVNPQQAPAAEPTIEE